MTIDPTGTSLTTLFRLGAAPAKKYAILMARVDRLVIACP